MWIYVPPESCPSAPEPQDSTSASAWRSQLLASSVALSGKLTLPASLLRAWKRAPWIKRLFGRIFEPSMAERGVAAWMASLVDSPAPRCPRPAADLGSTMRDGFGPASSELFARLGSGGDFLRTYAGFFQQTLDGSSDPFCEALPISGSMRNGSLYQRPTSAPATRESESSSWLTPCGMTGTDHTGKAGSGGELHMQAMAFPTPTAKDADGSRDTSMKPGSKRHKGKTLTDATAELWRTPCARDEHPSKIDGNNKRTDMQIQLAHQAGAWPTPRGEDSESCGNHPGATDSLTGAKKTWATPTGSDLSTPRKQTDGGRSLMTDVETWPTPTASDSEDAGKSGEKHGVNLPEATRAWPTPRVRSTLGDSGSPERLKEGPSPGLNDAAHNWPTPNSRDHKGSDLSSRHGGASLSHYAETGERTHGSPPSSPQVPVISAHGSELSPTALSTASRRRLNPAFVCWLMGWPWWWTNPAEISYARQATELYLSRLRTLLSSLLGGQGSSCERKDGGVWHTPTTVDIRGSSDGKDAEARYGTDEMRQGDQRLRNQAAVWNKPR